MKKSITLIFLLFIIVSSSVYPQYLSKYLVAYWSFDNGTAQDFSGNGYHGTIVNSPQVVPGHDGIGLAFRFTGKGDFISTTQSSTLIGDHIIIPFIDFHSLPEFTVTEWVREESMSNEQAGEAYIWFGTHEAGWLGFLNHIKLSPVVEYNKYIWYAVAGNLNPNSTVNFLFDYNYRNNWKFYSMVYENGKLSAYLDGILQGTINQTISIDGTDAGIACHFWNYGSYRKSARFTGSIDEVMIYRKALTPCEIMMLYDSSQVNPPHPKITGNNIICQGEETVLQVDSDYNSYEWSNGKTTKSITVSDSGTYSITVFDEHGCSGEDSIHVSILQSIELDILGDSQVCHGDSTKLFSNGNFSSYQWSTGEIKDTIIVDQSGRYALKVIDSNGCTAEAEFYLDVLPDISPQINGDSEFCDGDSTVLFTNQKFKSYQWSNGEQTEKITVKEAGKYYLTVTDSLGCKGTSEFDVVIHSNPKPVILSSIFTPCEGDTAILSTDKQFASYKWYSLPDSTLLSNSSQIYIYEEGKYYVSVTDANGCTGTSDVTDINFDFRRKLFEILTESGSNYIDFSDTGLLELNCLKIRIKNITDSIIYFDDSYLYGNIEFSIPQSQFPILIQPGEAKELEICFVPDTLGISRDTLLIKDICDDYLISLRGNGVPNEYFSSSTCNIPILLQSYAVFGKVILITTPPMPNPASGIITVPYNLFYIDSKPEIQAILYDVTGNELLEGTISIIETSKKESSFLETGDIYFNTANISNGIYYIRLNSGFDVISHIVYINQ